MIKVINISLIVTALALLLLGMTYTVNEPDKLESDTLIMYRFVNNLPYTDAPNIVGEFTPSCPNSGYPIYKVEILNFQANLVERICS